ncbi:MAG: envC 2 [Firmicutes bacterium]|nr:envC 2 [Bacillota bacterium]
MNMLSKFNNEQKVTAGQTTGISVKWLAVALCLFSIVLLGVFSNYYQAHSANNANNIVVTEMISDQSSEAGTTQNVDKITKNAANLAATPSIWPTSGEVSSRFGWRNSPWGGGQELHPGIDIANSMGTPIFATADGEVVLSGWSGGYGNIVQINHGKGIETIYGHNSRVIVSAGQAVKKGQVIAYLGSTGRSTGPHLHYEIRVNGTAVDPIRFLVL